MLLGYMGSMPFWSSLSFFEKINTIRHVGLFSFLREVIGLADAGRIRSRLESEYSALLQNYEAARDQIIALKQEKQVLEHNLQETTEKLEAAERASRGRNRALLVPPSAQSIMNAFNRNSASERERWFFDYYEDPYTGAVRLKHQFRFYPFAELNVPRGNLRLCDQYGTVANLAQCMDYAALPSRYAQHLVPNDFHAYRMRVLFVTDHDFHLWLANPRSAQDIVLEIRTHYKGKDYAAYNTSIRFWKEQYHEHNATACGTCSETLFYLILSIDELLCGGHNNFSQEEIKRIRNKCYAEYLDIYFNDKYDEED